MASTKKSNPWEDWKITIGPTADKTTVYYKGDLVRNIVGIRVEASAKGLSKVTLDLLALNVEVLPGEVILPLEISRDKKW